MTLCSYSSSNARRAWLLFVVLSLLGTVEGQHAPGKAAALGRAGTLTGRVFAITGGGDLKPARIAEVYLFLEVGVTKNGKAVDIGKTAGLAYEDEYLKAMGIFVKDYRENVGTWSDESVCKKKLFNYETAVLKAREWALANGKLSQVIRTTTDEEGKFVVSLPTGNYVLLVRGRAGFNEAVWVSGAAGVIVQPGSKTEIKLSSPEQSCLDIPR